MSFKSAFGNYIVNEELISTTVQGSNGGIPIFGTNGKIASLIPSSLQNIVVTSDYTIGITDQILIIQGTNGLSIYLPDVTVNQNRELVFVHNDRNSYVTTLTSHSGQLINGTTTYIMSADYSTVRLYSTGSKWLIIS